VELLASEAAGEDYYEREVDAYLASPGQRVPTITTKMKTA
jgi:hypothetical protein